MIPMTDPYIPELFIIGVCAGLFYKDKIYFWGVLLWLVAGLPVVGRFPIVIGLSGMIIGNVCGILINTYTHITVIEEGPIDMLLDFYRGMLLEGDEIDD